MTHAPVTWGSGVVRNPSMGVEPEKNVYSDLGAGDFYYNDLTKRVDQPQARATSHIAIHRMTTRALLPLAPQ